jgi:hypothetical protein
MLSPFHYYGVTDISVDGKLMDDNTDFNNLVSNERLKYRKFKVYGCDQGRIKVNFCKRVEEAKNFQKNSISKVSRQLLYLEKMMSKRGSLYWLMNLMTEDYLDYILTVDIFNEGV